MAIELEDGTIIRSLPEEVSHLGEQQEETQIQLDNLQARVEAALAGVLHYKGSVATYSDLPDEAEIGDVYNVIDTGQNYAWTGSEWDELGSIVDVSQLVDLTSAQTITGVKTFSNGLKVGNSTEIKESSSGTAILRTGTASFTFSQGATSFYSGSAYSLGNAGNRWKDLLLSGLISIGSGIVKYDSALSSFTVNSHLSPATTESYDLGSSTNKFKDLYLSGKANIGTRVVTEDNGLFSVRTTGDLNNAFLVGDSSCYTRGIQVLATNYYDIGTASVRYKDGYFSGQVYAENTLNLINSSDIVSNTLTQDQYDLITNGKPTKISGIFFNMTDILIEAVMDYAATSYKLYFVAARNINKDFYRGILNLNKTDKVLSVEYSRMEVIGNLNYLNGKQVPNYPSSTGTFTLKCVDGVLTWVQD